ncbi:hypothetical protein BU24DRAFT_487859 [Aaosphaeria arxii CBS 175.79]|uniref:Uncharacterized protein n=1 Tax=Aaosphaeria arxii CBS 175.79 TaxID=1450172 RepID=A0A6A5Y7D2_9PLEO|nr:uncharacterized protein BU24DRAFT_487859 [Aaosphaeria arxii CBS 175.79]KAF2021438.1 hypothetical protein BU24DRAFT_487859 [Aaosphaeria arxii CBS 175.79]
MARRSTVRGRAPKDTVAPASPITAVAPTPKKRGRPTKSEQIAKEPLKTKVSKPRGRPSKAKSTPVVAVQSNEAAQEAAPKRRGRPPKVASEAPAKPSGRPAKVAPQDKVQSPTKRRGRPLKAATSAVAGPARVTKRGRPAKATPVAPRIPPHLRSKLRTRVPKKEAPVVVEEKPKKTTGRGRGRPKAGTKAGTGAQAKKTARAAGVTKPAPRRRRGYIPFDVPKKFAAQVQLLLLDLEAAELASDEARVDQATDMNGEEEQEQTAEVEEQETSASNALSGPTEKDEVVLEIEEIREVVVEGPPAETFSPSVDSNSIPDIDGAAEGHLRQQIEVEMITRSNEIPTPDGSLTPLDDLEAGFDHELVTPTLLA